MAEFTVSEVIDGDTFKVKKWEKEQYTMRIEKIKTETFS